MTTETEIIRAIERYTLTSIRQNWRNSSVCEATTTITYGNGVAQGYRGTGESRIAALRDLLDQIKQHYTPTVMSYDEAAAEMKRLGLGFQVSASSQLSSPQSIAWKSPQEFYPPPLVISTEQNPNAAILDLLKKAKERWPEKHPWDDLGLDELITVCADRGWKSITFWENEDGWRASFLGRSGSKGETPANALRSAMKQKEKA